MIEGFLHNKKALFAFSDPAGAKSLLALAADKLDKLESLVVVSDRVYSFYSDFGLQVESYKNKSPSKWIEYSQAEVIVTGTSFPCDLEVEIIEEATNAGIITYSIVDHWVNFLIRFLNKNGELILPTWVWVIDERARDLAIAEGIPPEKILVLGNPYYKHIANWMAKEDKLEALETLGLPIDANYILYAPEPLSKFDLETQVGFTEVDGALMLYEAMVPMFSRGWKMIIKWHPNQNIAFARNGISMLDCENIIETESFNINDLMYYSACVVGFFSNSLLEAKIMGKPVIRPLYKMKENYPDPIKDSESKNFISCYDKDTFKRAVRGLGCT